MILLIVLLSFLQLIFMLPIKDHRERQRGFPWVTTTLVALNILIHFLVMIIVVQQTGEEALAMVHFKTLYPYMLVSQLITAGEGLGALPVLTSGFLHADLQHLLGNMFFLWFFGRKIEDSTGPFRFLLFYLFCLFFAGLVSVVANATLAGFDPRTPGLGASGAIAGLMAAYLFLYSEERILTLFSVWLAPVIPLPIPGGCFIPAPIPLWLPAWVFIVYKFLGDAVLGQLVQDLAELGEPIFIGVGVFAHLGGAAAGFLFIFFFLHPEVFAQRR